MGIDRLLATLRGFAPGVTPSRRDALMISLCSAVPLVPGTAQSGRGDPPLPNGDLVARRGAAPRTLQAKALDVYSVNDRGAKGDGTTDDTSAINAAITDVHQAGGGEIIFGASPTPYHVLGPVIIPSNVVLNLNGQTLSGAGFHSGTMFTTGVVRSGRLVSNTGATRDEDFVSYAAIRNGRIQKCALAFDLHNFNVSCSISDLATFEVLQFGTFHRCFYMSMNNCSARGPSDPTRPAFHFTGDNNLISLRRISATMASGFLFEGGTTALSMVACSCEGGVGSAVAFRGDCLGLVIDSGYWEAVSGIVFDFRHAGVCSVSFRGNYVNYTNTIIDDGGAASSATLFGSFDSSNYIANIGGTSEGIVYPGRMLLACPRNFIHFELPFANDAPATPPANWTVGPSIEAKRNTAFTGQSLSDVRTRSRQHYGAPISMTREGDVGNPYPGSVDRTRVALSKGANAAATVDSAITWRPNALRATFVLALVDDGGAHRLFGDIYGDQLVQHDRTGKRVMLEQYERRVRLQIADVDNRSGSASITGSLQICT